MSEKHSNFDIRRQIIPPESINIPDDTVSHVQSTARGTGVSSIPCFQITVIRLTSYCAINTRWQSTDTQHKMAASCVIILSFQDDSVELNEFGSMRSNFLTRVVPGYKIMLGRLKVKYLPSIRRGMNKCLTTDWMTIRETRHSSSSYNTPCTSGKSSRTMGCILLFPNTNHSKS
jgi:hypothetical protein